IQEAQARAQLMRGEAQRSALQMPYLPQQFQQEAEARGLNLEQLKMSLGFNQMINSAIGQRLGVTGQGGADQGSAAPSAGVAGGIHGGPPGSDPGAQGGYAPSPGTQGALSILGQGGYQPFDPE